MKKLVTSVLFTVMFSSAIFAQQKSYFDENWEPTSKEKMEYYREASKQQGNLTLIKDFYKNGTLQMEGLASDTTPGSEVFEGKVTWYFSNGKPSSTVEYKGGVINGISKGFDEKGRVKEDMKYNADGNYDGKMYSYKSGDYGSDYNSISEYKNSNMTYTIVYDDSMKGIRSETFYKDGVESEAKFYDEKGKLIGSRTMDSNYNYKGTSVEYYYNPMVVSKIDKFDNSGTVTDSKTFFKNGKLLQEAKLSKKDGTQTTYDENGNKIGNLTYRFNKELGSVEANNGKEYNFNYGSTSVMYINVYKDGAVVSTKNFDEEGVLQKETFYKDSYEDKATYYKSDGSVKSTITYKDGSPYNGTISESLIEESYKDGVLQQSKMLFEDGKIRLDKKLNAAKNNYEGKIYDEEGALLYSFTRNVEEEVGFTGDITQYEKGKIINKATAKDGLLVSGKIKVTTYEGFMEMEKKGDWFFTRKLSETGKLISEMKEAAKTDDDYYSPSAYISEDLLLNYYY